MHTLTVREGVELAHALVDRVASIHGIRALLIKGPVLNAQRLRLPRDSQDVDVLVDPARFEEMLDGLAAIGWYPYFALPTHGTDRRTNLPCPPAHSVSLKHDAWPCALDVHQYFPGCLAPPQRVFDELWDRRSWVDLAGREIPCPDVLGSAVIVGLHALGSPDAWREKAELVYLRRVLDQLDVTERADLAALAPRMGAGDILCPMLKALGVHPSSATPGAGTPGAGTPGSADDLAAWHLRTVSGRYPSLPWLAELGRTPWRRRPAVLWRAALLREDEIRFSTPDLPPGRWGLARAPETPAQRPGCQPHGGLVPREEPRSPVTADDATVYARSDDVSVVGSGHRVVVLDLIRLDRSPTAFVGTAARIWQAIDGEREQELLVAHLADQLDTTPEQIAGEVRAFLAQLLTLGLIIRIADQSA